jgi:DNA processing protein
MNISDKEKIDCIRLIRSENVGSKTFQSLIALYGSAGKALEAIPKMAIKGGRKPPIKLCSESDVIKEIDACAKKGARMITILDSEYPKLLQQISDFPPVLTVFGKSDILNKTAIAVVGARNASANGCRFAEDLCRDLGRAGIVIVSGLARGIDTVAHKGSLETGTVAVVAGGIDKIYPPENKDLFMKIAENGAVIAEMPFGSVPKSQNFPRRNRIISGISLGTIVVEASLNSGSLITARMALEQNREVFAVPGSPLDPRCVGTNKLIQQGAHMVMSSDDVMQELGSMGRADSSMLESGDSFRPAKVSAVSDSDLDKARPYVCEKIGSSPTAVDDIISQTGLPTNIILTILLELELAGRLDRHSGNKVSLVYAKEELFIQPA